MGYWNDIRSITVLIPVQIKPSQVVVVVVVVVMESSRYRDCALLLSKGNS